MFAHLGAVVFRVVQLSELELLLGRERALGERILQQAHGLAPPRRSRRQHQGTGTSIGKAAAGLAAAAQQRQGFAVARLITACSQYHRQATPCPRAHLLGSGQGRVEQLAQQRNGFLSLVEVEVKGRRPLGDEDVAWTSRQRHEVILLGALDPRQRLITAGQRQRNLLGDKLSPRFRDRGLRLARLVGAAEEVDEGHPGVRDRFGQRDGAAEGLLGPLVLSHGSQELA